MSILPKKPGPQLWVDVPLFGEPDPEPVVRKRSKKQDDDDAKVKWRRRPKTARQVPCHDCTKEHQAQARPGIGWASYIRIEGNTEVYYCFLHKIEFEHSEKARRK